MRQSFGFEVKSNSMLICRLLKFLYKLKITIRQCNTQFDEFMDAQGFSQTMYDPSVYMKKLNNEIFNFIIVIL